MRKASFRTSRIVEIHYCGPRTLELLVHDDYVDALTRRLKPGCVLRNYNPTSPPTRDGETAVPPSVMEKARENFKSRMQFAAQRRPGSLAARFYLDVCQKHGFALSTATMAASASPATPWISWKS